MSKRLAALHQNAPRAGARGPHVPHDFLSSAQDLGPGHSRDKGTPLGQEGPPSGIRYLSHFPLLQHCSPVVVPATKRDPADMRGPAQADTGRRGEIQGEDSPWEAGRS